MKICEDGHDEIVFDAKYCPSCEAKSEIDSLQDEINKLLEEKEAEENDKS